jgi:hypothetical protein
MQQYFSMFKPSNCSTRFNTAIAGGFCLYAEEVQEKIQ